MNPITINNLNNTQKPLELPQVNDNTNYNQLMSDNLAMVNNDYNTTQSQYNQALQKQNQTITDITNTSTGLANKTADTQQALDTAGATAEQTNLNNLVTQLSGLNSQASALNREAQAIPIQTQQQAEGKGVTQAGVAPIQTANLRDNAIKALSIAQQADITNSAITGSQIKLQQAKEKAQQIIDLKYKPQEAKLETLKLQYNANKDYLESIDKKLATAYKNKLDMQTEAIKNAKDNEKAITSIIVTAQGNSAPADLVAMASKAKTPMEAAVILGKYSGEYLKNELLKAQIAKEYAIAAKDRASISSTGSTSGTSVKVSNSEIVDLNEAITAKNSVLDSLSKLKSNIQDYGTGEIYNETASGQKESLQTNILLALKNLEKTGALDKGTIDVIEKTLPGNEFFAFDDKAISKIDTLYSQIESKSNEYIDSYKGTTAELDPRTSRAYKNKNTDNQTNGMASRDMADFERLNKETSSYSTPSIYIQGFNFKNQ